MRYLEYRENRKHGTFDFPFAFYSINSHHPRYNMVYHWHTEYEIIRILSGELTLVLDGVEYVAHSGDCVFISDGVLHGARPADCRYECIVFDLNALVRENSASGRSLLSVVNREKTVHSFIPASETEIRPFVTALFEAMEARHEGSRLMAEGAVYSFLATVIKNGLYDTDTSACTLSRRRLGQLKGALSTIKNRYSESLTLDDLAVCAGMNSRYFCRFFKQMTNMTPIEYLNYYRIECACEQMATSYRSITEVALNCGFNDLSYFIKVFKSYKGTTPMRYLSKAV